MEAHVVTAMLALFRSDEPSYQPVHPSRPLQLEDGDPRATVANLKQIGLVIQDIWVRKAFSRVLLQFNTGEQYLALGLSDPAALAQVAADAGYGDLEHLKSFYSFLGEDYEGKLPAASDLDDCPDCQPGDLQDSGDLDGLGEDVCPTGSGGPLP